MTKSKAIEIFKNRGSLNKFCNISWSSKNSKYQVYWSNAQFKFLELDWYLILNDNENGILYLFFIPNNSLKKETLRMHTRRPQLMHIEIYYNDPTFTDRFSDYSFRKFLVDEIQY